MNILQVPVKTRTPRSDPVVDKERAKEVIATLYADYRSQRKLFQHVSREIHAPQKKYFPPGVEIGGPEHQRWLFFAAMTDRREESERVYASHAQLAEKYSQLYTPRVTTMSAEEIERILKSEKVGSPGQSAKYWPRCAETLFGYFSGDPLQMYQGRTINELLVFKKEEGEDRLPGFGPKILSLLALFYEELGLISMPQDAFPVDVHVQRFAISTGIVSGKGNVLNEKVEKVLRPLLCQIVIEEELSALELSHAIWFLGNRLCNGCYRNSTSKILCPTYAQCNGSISTKSYFRKGLWDLDASRHRKGGDATFTLSDSLPLFSQSPD